MSADRKAFYRAAGGPVRNYVVKTRFGEINVAWSNIAEARRDAKRRFGVGPECVTPEREYTSCDDCDSAPCVCPERAP